MTPRELMYHLDDTIAAIASASGPAARGIVRVSGPRAVSIVSESFRSADGIDLSALAEPTAVAGIVNTSLLRDVPADLYLWPGARSYTRQPLAELHTMGSMPLLSAVLKSICAAGARLAEPGEFTLRAFLAGRMDLTQAEAVLGVIDARGGDELQTALAQLAGGLAHPLSSVREKLLNLLAELEAGLDFVDEDIEFVTRDQIERGLDDAHQTISTLAAQMTSRGRHDALPRAALVGWPNVGKSSLFNALAACPAALVSAEPGTTRDYLLSTLDVGGTRFQLIDTAGRMPNSASSPLDAIADRSAVQIAESCEIRLLCLDSSRSLNDWEEAQLDLGQNERTILVALTKCDMPLQANVAVPVIRTSSTSGQGLDALRETIAAAVRQLDARLGTVGATADRAAESMRAASEAIVQASKLNRADAGQELVAAEVRLALAELGRVAGAVYTDDLLDRVFSRFCIGK
jgi:tRNA modification GTPase